MPKRYSYITVDVFTDRAFAGNPLAVVTEASGLTPEQMQTIAAEFNYSESTFVLPPDDPSHTARVRIFTRQNEIPFAGHPNVGTAFVIALVAERNGKSIGPTVIFEEGAGRVPVDLLRDAEGRVMGATLTAPQPLTVGKTIPAAVVAECVGLEPTAVRTSNHEPVVASVGLPFVIAEVAAEPWRIPPPAAPTARSLRSSQVSSRRRTRPWPSTSSRESRWGVRVCWRSVPRSRAGRSSACKSAGGALR
jgi:trans-2,3-dihydro-3-hydroxyanthranilate isomerase